jgi:hypothetical protein
MVLPDATAKVMDYGIARARRFDGLTVAGRRPFVADTPFALLRKDLVLDLRDFLNRAA